MEESGKKSFLFFAVAAVVFILFLIVKWGGGTSENPGGDGAQGQQESPCPSESPAMDDAGNRVAREGKLAQGWEQDPCIVLDAGHGGFDPGKIGINDALEKDVNLKIAGLVRDYLEASGVKVVMTRQEDQALCDSGSDNMKVRDLKQRIAIIEENCPVAAVSIHQNSYPEESVHGAQVFYYSDSTRGRQLAETIQARLIAEADPENRRRTKPNDSYYLLKKTAVPLVIVECGFLSNSEEAAKLCTEEYQDTVAWAVYLGIMDYLETVRP